MGSSFFLSMQKRKQTKRKLSPDLPSSPNGENQPIWGSHSLMGGLCFPIKEKHMKSIIIYLVLIAVAATQGAPLVANNILMNNPFLAG
jgi:hypothetical protein